ncbi:WXG100 family type VII secretion target [Nocardioides cheoyonin]|uniref:WXG100 family type VII secretion target n=1 Tax=Nocardioides cheoyonin TaxID=3156615 RepID=UPI0032B416CC
MTSGNEIRQDHSLNTASQALVDAREELRRKAARLESAIMHYQKDFQGDAGDAFFALHTLWQDRHRQITNALNVLSDGLTGTHKLGMTADETIASYAKQEQKDLSYYDGKLGG